MKILSIQAAYFPMIGGAEVFHQKITEWLTKQGHQVDVLTCIWDKPDISWPNWNKEKEKLNAVDIYRIKPWFYKQFLKSIGAVWPLYQKALQLIKVKNYDLVHAHIFPALIVGAMLKRKTGLPLITTIQGGDLADYAETGKGISKVLKPIIGWCLGQANIVHTVSTHMEKSVKKLGIKNTKVIPNGVDISLFKSRNKMQLRKKFELANKKFIIISHSRLTPKNGLDLLVRAIARVPRKSEVLLLIVGGGEQEKELKNLVLNLGLSHQIKFYGYQDRVTTAELLSLSDIFVRPSRQEGFGIAFLEAMAAGLSVVGMKVGGIMEIVNDGVDGFLIDKEGVHSLIDILERLRNKVELRRKLGENGRRKVINKYSWNKIYPRIEGLYQRIISG